MAYRRRSSIRTLIATVAAVAIVPLCVLFWVGWRLREQDRSLASQQMAQRVETAADIVAAAVARSVAGSRQRLEARAADWPAGAVSITTGPSRFEASPRGRLAWVPLAPPQPQAADTTFAEGETLEFQQHNPKGAEPVYRKLYASTDPSIRAAAGIRLARVLRSLGRPAEAAEVYAAMDRLDGVAIDGVPASLVALHARGELHPGIKLREDLRRGRWVLTRPVYTLYAGEDGGEPEALAAAVEQLREQWRRNSPEATGTALIQTRGQQIAVIHQTSGAETRALLATAAFVDEQWMGPAKAAAAAQRVRLSLGANGKGAVRKAAETNLPWNLHVASADPAAELAELTGRQRLLESGFLLLAVLTLTASAFTIRALRREWEVSKLQSEFVSAVSHEFRTPLTSLRQFTEMLRDGRELSESRRQLCYNAQARAADRLTRLVVSLLDFSRLESGGQPYALQRCQAGPFVRDVVDDFKAEIQASGRAVELIAHGSGPVDADAEALKLALWNLLDNAFKYSPDQKTVEAGVHRRDGHIAITVRDQGMGIPRHEQQLIFTRFRRGAQAAKLGIKGTGIGLAMADQIVRAHHGRIELESEPGKGSCFTILLPVKE